MHFGSTSCDSHRHGFGRRAYLRMALMSGAVLAGVAAAGCGWREAHRSHWGGWSHADWNADPESAKQHAKQITRWTLRAVEATEEQQARIDAIVGRLVDDLQPLMRAHRTNHDAMMAAFTAPSVDAEALDRARQSDLELAEQAYTRVTAAFAEAGNILTREQRIELAAAAQRWRR